MIRREALRALAAESAAGALAGGIAIAATPPAPTAVPKEADPTFEAIEAHRSAWSIWQATDPDADEGAWDQASKTEAEAWEGVCEIHPTTMEGLAAMSGYIGRFCRSDLPPDGPATFNAFLTIATVAARLSHDAGKAA